MVIHLNAEVLSGLGEDTFWRWMLREFDAVTTHAGPDDIVLQYSTLGAPSGVGIGLLWELYPEMKRVFKSNEWDDKLRRIAECAEGCTLNIVPTKLVASLYPNVGTRVVPIGVDFDMFYPPLSRPRSMKIGLWVGSMHPMKGYQTLLDNRHKADTWIIVWKNQRDMQPINNWSKQYARVSQDALAAMMREATFYAVTGNLRPYFLVEYEAMATDLPLMILGEQEKDFKPVGRDGLRKMGWDRKDCKKVWEGIFEELK